MDLTSQIAIIYAASAIRMILALLPATAVPRLLFGGSIQPRHQTKFAFRELVDRYKSSIDDVNSSLTLSIGLAVIALYSYFALPVSGEVNVPFIGIKISRQLWISVVPAIAFALQVFGFTAFIWFMLLRIGLKLILNRRSGSDDDYGDVTNIALRGAIGHLWIAIRIREFYESRWNYLWYLPFLCIVLTVFLSPLLVCSFSSTSYSMPEIWRLALCIRGCSSHFWLSSFSISVLPQSSGWGRIRFISKMKSRRPQIWLDFSGQEWFLPLCGAHFLG